jgi:hypothetical protein
MQVGWIGVQPELATTHRRRRAGTLLVFGAIYAKAAQKFAEHRQHVQVTEAKHHEDDQ